MTRPMFHCAFDNPTAATSWSRGTRFGNVVWNDGNVNIDTLPARKATAANPPGRALPLPTHTAIAEAITDEAMLPTTNTFRRRSRSAIAEPIGPTNAAGMKPAAVTNAAEVALPVVWAT